MPFYKKKTIAEYGRAEWYFYHFVYLEAFSHTRTISVETNTSERSTICTNWAPTDFWQWHHRWWTANRPKPIPTDSRTDLSSWRSPGRVYYTFLTGPTLTLSRRPCVGHVIFAPRTPPPAGGCGVLKMRPSRQPCLAEKSPENALAAAPPRRDWWYQMEALSEPWECQWPGIIAEYTAGDRGLFRNQGWIKLKNNRKQFDYVKPLILQLKKIADFINIWFLQIREKGENDNYEVWNMKFIRSFDIFLTVSPKGRDTQFLGISHFLQFFHVCMEQIDLFLLLFIFLHFTSYPRNTWCRIGIGGSAAIVDSWGWSKYCFCQNRINYVRFKVALTGKRGGIFKCFSIN